MADTPKGYNCTICGSSRHFYMSCEKVMCSRCNCFGHTAETCPKKWLESDIFAIEFRSHEVKVCVTEDYPRTLRQPTMCPINHMTEYNNFGVRIRGHGDALTIQGYTKTVTILLSEEGLSHETCMVLKQQRLTIGHRYTLMGAWTFTASDRTASGRNTQEIRPTPIYVIIQARRLYSSTVRLNYCGFRHILGWVPEQENRGRMEAVLFSAHQYNAVRPMMAQFDRLISVRGDASALLPPEPRATSALGESGDDISMVDMQDRAQIVEEIMSPDELLSPIQSTPVPVTTGAYKVTNVGQTIEKRQENDHHMAMDLSKPSTSAQAQAKMNSSGSNESVVTVTATPNNAEKPATLSEIAVMMQRMIEEAFDRKKTSRRMKKVMSKEKKRQVRRLMKQVGGAGDVSGDKVTGEKFPRTSSSSED